MEQVLVKAQFGKLFDIRSVELFKGEYALTTIMPTKKDIFGN
jgi:hypothetical protein